MSFRGLFVNVPRQKMEVQDQGTAMSYVIATLVYGPTILDRIQCSKSGPLLKV